MKRPTRWLFNSLAALSLSLGFIILIGWGLGGRAGQTWHVAYDSGQAGSTQHNWEIHLSGEAAFSWYANHWTRWTFHRAVIPYWAILAVLAVLPTVWMRTRPPRPARPGYCARCAYDLRATPGRCPECGRMVVAAASSR
jgi:hypothetical protein